MIFFAIISSNLHSLWREENRFIIHTSEGLKQKKKYRTTNYSVIKPLDLIIGLLQTQIYIFQQSPYMLLGYSLDKLPY